MRKKLTEDSLSAFFVTEVTIASAILAGLHHSQHKSKGFRLKEHKESKKQKQRIVSILLNRNNINQQAPMLSK